MSQFKIDKGVPLTNPKGGKWGMYCDLIKQMEPGDSVLLKTASEASTMCMSGKVKNLKLTTRKQADGTYRVWYIGPLEKDA